MKQTWLLVGLCLSMGLAGCGEVLDEVLGIVSGKKLPTMKRRKCSATRLITRIATITY